MQVQYVGIAKYTSCFADVEKSLMLRSVDGVAQALLQT
jgi:hypothetical protein